MNIDYVTGNEGKYREAKEILKSWQVSQVTLKNLVEIQGDRFTVVKAKAKAALEILKSPLIVDDVSLCCNGLNGLPGPYAKAFLEQLGERGFSELILKLEDQRCQFICLIAFIEPGQEPQIFEGITEGKIVSPRGNLRHGTISFNTIFQPAGLQKTLGEMTLAEMALFASRSIALNQLKTYLEKA